MNWRVLRSQFEQSENYVGGLGTVGSEWETDFQWHGKAPSKEQAEQAIKILEAEK